MTMDGFNIGKIFMSLRNPEILFRKLHNVEQNKVQSFAPEINTSVMNSKTPNNQTPNIQNLESLTQQIQMNTLQINDKSVFIRNMLGLPQNLAEVLITLQNPTKPLLGGTLGLGNINGDLLKNQGALAKVFNDNPTLPEIAAINNTSQNAKIQNDAILTFFSGMISLPDISKLIIQNGKHAVASLIIAMASASKQGISNEQMQETLGIINSCISMAESNNPAQSLKSLMMLYIPWLPLNEGVGFDLEITSEQGENESNNSKLTVLIQTKNYGNLKGVFTLTTSNSVDIYIICNDNFPKNLLLKNLQEESNSHAMNTNIDIEETKTPNDTENETQETKVNLSATNEMNPYLLLMAHSFIRNTILLDNSAI